MVPQSTSTEIAHGGEPEADDSNQDPSNGNDVDKETASPIEQQNICQKSLQCLCEFYGNNDFICQVVIVILLARAYPPLGAEYLYPEITSTWIAVLFIFVLAGLGLKTEEFSKAFQRLYFNLFVQIFNLGVVSAIVFGVSRGLVFVGVIAQSLADGMVVCASLPLTINMVLVLTKSAGGEEASAIFNAAFGNMLGVFLSPVLILGYLGVTGDIDLLQVFFKLSLRVVAPIIVGQIFQKFVPSIVAFHKEYKPRFKKAQQLALVFIVYTVFCRTFAQENNDTDFVDIIVMIILQFILLCALMMLAWIALKVLFPNEPKLRVMGLFGCTHKTVAMGVPLINAIYEDNPLVGLYTLPLLIWHPMQLVIGSFLAPKLYRWVQEEKQRLGIHYEDDEAEKNEPSPTEEQKRQNESEDASRNAEAKC